MDKEKWTSPVGAFGWLCGRCQQGHLRKKDKSWSELRTAATVKARAGEDWEPEWDEYRFAGLLHCDNPQCGDVVSAGGLVTYEHWRMATGDYESAPTYHVAFLNPPPNPFRMDAAVPEPVSDRIKEAASLIWADNDAAANKIRQAVECLLDERGVKKYPRTGSRTPINLHHRIESYAKIAPKAGGPLLAIKWIGNEGSHEGGLARADVLDAFEIMEVVLEEVYVGHRRALFKKIKAINARKKPLGKVRKRSI